MRVGIRIALCFAGLFAAANTALGAITASWERVIITPAAIADDISLGTMQTWDLMVTTDGNWASAGLRAVLPVGSFFYKHVLGSNLRPDPALVSNFPALAFTTHVGFPTEPVGPAPPLSGFPDGQPVSLGDPTAAIPGTLSMAWGDLVIDPPGTYQIARLTFPQDVFPNVINIADVGIQGPFSRTSQVSPDSTTEIPDIPEPAALSLMSLLGLRLAARRRAPCQVC